MRWRVDRTDPISGIQSSVEELIPGQDEPGLDPTGFQLPETIPEFLSREFRLKVGSTKRETGDVAPLDPVQQVRTGILPNLRGAEQRPSHCGFATEPVRRLGRRHVALGYFPDCLDSPGIGAAEATAREFSSKGNQSRQPVGWHPERAFQGDKAFEYGATGAGQAALQYAVSSMARTAGTVLAIDRSFSSSAVILSRDR